MRRGTFSHAYTPQSFTHTPLTQNGIALFAVRFTSRSSFLFLHFSLPLSRACGPLLILCSYFRLSSSCASARNLPRDYSRVDTDSARTHFPTTLFFLTFPYATATTTATRKCACGEKIFLPCSCARRSNAIDAITENLRHKTRQLKVYQ